MTTTTYGNTSSAPGKSHNGDGLLQKASVSAHSAVDSMSNAADEAARRAKPVIDRVAEKAHHTVNTAAEAMEPTAEWLVEQGEALHAAEKKLVADTCNYISANPLKSAGFALLAGFVLSRIILR